jgi:hypothetical protein
MRTELEVTVRIFRAEWAMKLLSRFLIDQQALGLGTVDAQGIRLFACVHITSRLRSTVSAILSDPPFTPYRFRHKKTPSLYSIKTPLMRDYQGLSGQDHRLGSWRNQGVLTSEHEENCFD